MDPYNNDIYVYFELFIRIFLTSALRPPTPLVMSTTVVVTFPSFTTRVVIFAASISSLHLGLTTINTITN